jgi:hypothetical protein
MTQHSALRAAMAYAESPENEETALEIPEVRVQLRTGAELIGVFDVECSVVSFRPRMDRRTPRDGWETSPVFFSEAEVVLAWPVFADEREG